MIRELQDFYKVCNLAGVRFTALHAEGAGPQDTDEVGSALLQASWEMQDDDRLLVVAFRVSLRTENVKYRVVAAAAYRSRTDGRFGLTEEVADDLINNSAIITVTPFLREAVVSLAGRLGDEPAPLIPLVGSATGERMVIMEASED